MKKICIFIICTSFFIGCSIKEADSTTTKTAKHIANSPMYAIAGAGLLYQAAGAAVGYTISEPIDILNNMDLHLGETHLGKYKEDVLDTNTTLTKIYTDRNIAVYKDRDNDIYLYDQFSEDLIKDVKFGYKRKTTSQGVYFPIHKVELEEVGMDEDYLYSKFTKDKLGNPSFLGNNTVVRVERSRRGWAMRMYTTLYLIIEGAKTVNAPYDKTLPSGVYNQIDYFFPSKVANK